jgi:hypothetical protein
MLSELTQWFTPAIVILGFLFTARTIRNPRVEVESRMDRMESRLAARIDGLESQNSDLRDRMGRIEGTLDVLREFFVGTGRGTVA